VKSFARCKNNGELFLDNLSLQTSLSWAELPAWLIFCFSVPLKVVYQEKRGGSDPRTLYLMFYDYMKSC
jgi:hypothetical protein